MVRREFSLDTCFTNKILTNLVLREEASLSVTEDISMSSSGEGKSSCSRGSSSTTGVRYNSGNHGYGGVAVDTVLGDGC